MRKVLILLAVAALPLSAGCCCTRPGTPCPLCPCNWFNRTPVCAPAPTFAAPVVATPTYVPSPCAPVCAPASTAISPLAATVSPQFVSPQFAAPQAMPMMTQAPICCPPPMSACCPPEPNCCYSPEPSCGGPFMGAVSYGPMDGGGSGSSGGGCSGCEGSTPTVAAPAPERFVDPAPAKE